MCRAPCGRHHGEDIVSISSNQPTEIGPPRSGSGAAGEKGYSPPAGPPRPSRGHETQGAAGPAQPVDREFDLIAAARAQADAPLETIAPPVGGPPKPASEPSAGDFSSEVPPADAFPGYRINRKIHSG